MISKYKKSFEPLIAIIAKPFLSWNPSVLTFLSLLSAIVFFFGIMEHLYWLSVMSTIGFLFDALDGYVARYNGLESAFGAFLDSTLDRISDFFFIAAFGYARLVSWELVIVVLFTTFLISYMRSRGEAGNGLMQRSERILLLLSSFFLFLIFPKLQIMHLSVLTIGFALIFILNCITILQRFIYFAKK